MIILNLTSLKTHPLYWSINPSWYPIPLPYWTMKNRYPPPYSVPTIHLYLLLNHGGCWNVEGTISGKPIFKNSPPPENAPAKMPPLTFLRHGIFCRRSFFENVVNMWPNLQIHAQFNLKWGGEANLGIKLTKLEKKRRFYRRTSEGGRISGAPKNEIQKGPLKKTPAFENSPPPQG